ncbi:hypothetical protein MKC50_05895, partial [[Clostridium] innocuum]|nr:hypothetical protein [[Clostridium] innocuum]
EKLKERYEKQKENKDEKKDGCIHLPPVHRPLRWGYSACFLDKQKSDSITEISNNCRNILI